MAMQHCEGFVPYEPKSEKAQAAWAGKDLMKPSSKHPYSFTWDDGVAVSGEFKNEYWVVSFQAPGHEPVEMLFSQPPVFISTRG